MRDKNPLKEMVVIDLIGNHEHPHMVGCNEILFDEQNVYIILPNYDSLDLFDYWCSINVLLLKTMLD
jgi:hypothetical protein